MERNRVIYLLLVALIVATIDCCKKKRTTWSPSPGENFVNRLRNGTENQEKMLNTFKSLSSKDKEYVILNVDVTIAEELLSISGNEIIEQVCFKLTSPVPSKNYIQSPLSPSVKIKLGKEVFEL